MAEQFVTNALGGLEISQGSHDVKSAGYLELLKQIATKSQPQSLTSNYAAFGDSVLQGNLGIVATRPLLSAYVLGIGNLPDTQTKIDCGKHALANLEPQFASFEEQDAQLRDILANAFQEQGEFIEAAKSLQGIRLETSQRKFSDEDKVRLWIRICRLYIEEDDTIDAETYLNRAKTLLYKFQDRDMILTFQLCQARILDSRHKFLEASQAYHTVSLSYAVAEEERNMALSKAIICAVLSPAGPQRSRALGKLYKDERAGQLEEYGILEKMYLDRIISKEEATKFGEKLDQHQLAQTADGSTVLAKAVIEHNLFGASKLYSNLDIIELGHLLGLGPERAERYAARMLEQKRLAGRIDQIQGVVFFGDGGRTEKAAFSPTGQILRIWDQRVQVLVEDVERVSSFLRAGITTVSPMIRCRSLLTVLGTLRIQLKYFMGHSMGRCRLMTSDLCLVIKRSETQTTQVL